MTKLITSFCCWYEVCYWLETGNSIIDETGKKLTNTEVDEWCDANWAIGE